MTRLPYVRPGEGDAPVELCFIESDGYHVFPLTVARAAALAADLAQAVARELAQRRKEQP